MALRDLVNLPKTDTPSARFSVGAEALELRLAAARSVLRAYRWAPAGAQLLVARRGRVNCLQATSPIEHREGRAPGARRPVGLSTIARQHTGLAQWQMAGGRRPKVREGDWIRITLIIDSSAPRHFVAVTDAVPGGLRPTDLALSGVGALDLQRVADQGSSVFATRRLDPRSPKFYAEYLPAGRHELHYFARAGNGGDYLAAPAFVELMYGNATSARTAATRLRIAAGND